MKIFRILFCILALGIYAGCDFSSKVPVAHTPTTGEVVQNFSATQPQKLPMKHASVRGGEQEKAFFRVQVADTFNTRTMGLMFREKMPQDEGMVFLFETEQPLNFWMKNTLIPLDIVYMDNDWKVVSIQKNARPCKEDPCMFYPSKERAKYVLEINAGLSDKFGIAEGDIVQLQ
jgi:hypothetical protein